MSFDVTLSMLRRFLARAMGGTNGRQVVAIARMPVNLLR